MQINLSHFVLACFSETLTETEKLLKEAEKQILRPKSPANTKSESSPVKKDVDKEAEKKVSNNESPLLKSSLNKNKTENVVEDGATTEKDLSDLKQNSFVQDKFYTPHPGVDCASRVRR